MRLIRPEDEQIFQVVTLSGKFGQAASLVDRYQDRYDQRPDEPGTAFAYALAVIAALPAAGSPIVLAAWCGTAATVLDEVADAQADHWLARYLRARLRGLMCQNGITLNSSVTAELGWTLGELDELIERQSALPWRPYFACAYLLAAQQVHQLQRATGEPEGAVRIGDLVGDAARHTARPVPFRALSALLCEPFIELHRAVAARRRTVGDLMVALFPDQRAVRDELARYAGAVSA